MSKPRILDLFCGAGGAAMGYHRAGFEVVGVDIKPQPHYPFEFHQADALTYPLEGFDAIHASPPCQFFTQMRASWRAQGVNDGYTDLLTPTLARLAAQERPFAVENVVGAGKVMRSAACRLGLNVISLHGGMFALRVQRSRLFASNVFMLALAAPAVREPIGVYDTRPRGTEHFRTRKDMKTGKKSAMRIARTLEEGSAAMEIDWMTWLELKEAIPPAYTEFIGRQLLAAIEAEAAL